MASGDLKMLTSGSPLVNGAILLVIILFTGFVLTRPKKLDLPIVGSFGADQRQALVEGTRKYPDRPFLVPVVPPLVILPISVIDEVRNLPENKTSFIQDIQRSFTAKHTGVGKEAGPELIHALKLDLTKHLASTIDDMQDEIGYGLDKELGSCKDWTSIPVYPKVTRLVGLLSGRVFVGLPLSRDEEWLKSSIEYALLCMGARDAINAYPEFIRTIVAPFLKEVQILKYVRNRGVELVKPLLATGQENMITWIQNRIKKKDPEKIANNQMSLSFAAIHTTSMAITAAIYDLCAYPEYIEILREEIQQIDGVTKTNLAKLWKLDSFLKESQRLTPPSLVTNVRLVTSPLNLSTGTLPTGSRFGFAAWAIHTPHLPFDGLRYYKLRQIPGNEDRHQFVTTSPESLNFGYGNHACPGRFLAANEIKIVLIELLTKWEFRLKGGERPENILNAMICMPNPRAEVEFRRR
ncbi:Cytochrome monooxygenase ascG [Botrytis cinerea]